MTFSRCFVLAMLVAVFALVVPSAHADEVADAGRSLLEARKDAVVTIKLVVSHRWSMQGSGSDQDERKIEVTGTVIDPSGLVVISLFSADPTEMMSEPGSDFKVESEVKDAKILNSAGKEIPAEVVLRDKDLDLAFIRPKEKQQEPFICMDLSDASKPAVLDQVLSISRLGKVANRTYGARIDRIEAVVDKPRTFYVPLGIGMSEGSLGTPVFSMNGKIVGVAVLRAVKAGGGGGGFFGDDGMAPIMIVIPAEDILEVAKQAPQHAAEKKE